MKIYITGGTPENIKKAKAELRKRGIKGVAYQKLELGYLSRRERFKLIGECDGLYALKNWKSNIEFRYDVHEAQRLFLKLFFENCGGIVQIQELILAGSS